MTVLILLIIAIFIIGWLLYIFYLENQELKKIFNNMDLIMNGNSLIGFKTQLINPRVMSLSNKLNELMNYFNKTVTRVQHLETIKKQMINNISHDIRTPLSSILGYAEALMDEKSITEEKRQQYLSVILKKGNQLEMMLQDFFEYTKLEDEEVTVHLEKVNLVEVIEEEILSFYADFKKHNINPLLELPPSPVYIYVNLSGIKRILSNLLSNALRYGSSNGELGVVMRLHNKTVSVEIWDNGSGIQSSDLPYIFERLYTAEHSRNTHLQGTGLGLSVTKILVEKHQGQIFVSSLPNKKTSFVFYLPLSM